LAFLSVYLVLDLPQRDNSHWSVKFFRIDFVGAFTLVSAVFLLLFGLDNGSNKGWGKRITFVPLALVPVLFAVFVLVEAKVAKEPFAPGRIIFDPHLLAAYGANFFGVASHVAVLFFIALFFQAALGMSATWSGVMFVPSTVSALAGSLLGGLVMKRTGRYYCLTLIGYALLLLGVVPMVVGAGQQSAAGTGVGLAVLSFGASICKLIRVFVCLYLFLCRILALKTQL
jgi:predicted MFS family arabinose efflux permease